MIVFPPHHVVGGGAIEQWARLVGDLVMSMLYAAFAIRVYVWRRDDLIGHKRYLTCVIWFFVISSVCAGYWAFAIYTGTRFAIVYVVLGRTLVVGVLFVATELNAAKLKHTLQMSEAHSREIEASAEKVLKHAYVNSRNLMHLVNTQRRNIADRVARNKIGA